MTDTVLILVLGGAGTAIMSLAGLLWRERDARAKAETALALANQKLAGYEDSAPALITQVEALLAELHGEPPLNTPRPRAIPRRRPRAEAT